VKLASSNEFSPEKGLFSPNKICVFIIFGQKEKPANTHVYWLFWRRARDSNPRTLAGLPDFECGRFIGSCPKIALNFSSHRKIKIPQKSLYIMAIIASNPLGVKVFRSNSNPRKIKRIFRKMRRK